MNYIWRATKAPRRERHTNIWFISPQVGWAVNSAGEIIIPRMVFRPCLRYSAPRTPAPTCAA